LSSHAINGLRQIGRIVMVGNSNGDLAGHCHWYDDDTRQLSK
jgi:hypothetical protein